MISHITGKLLTIGEETVVIEVNGMGYEVLVPEIVRRGLFEKKGQAVTLVTYEYIETGPGRGVNIPRLIGFNNEVEKEFFELLLKVPGMGPTKAIKALIHSFSVIAKAIELGDSKILDSLPGVGGVTAGMIIAKLKGKAGKFALIQDEHLEEMETPEPEVESEAREVLVKLGYKAAEIRKMIEGALAKEPKPKSVEELIQRIYRATKK